MTASTNQSQSWQQAIQRSFLSVYQLPSSQLADDEAGEYFHGYDMAFEFDHAWVYLLVNSQVLKTRESQIDLKKIHKLRKQTLNPLIKRHSQLYRKHQSAYDPKIAQTQDGASDDKPIYFIGLTSLTIKQSKSNRVYSVMHQYGSRFFAEECVLDLDDERQVIQIFSLPSFMAILEKLHTPSDLLAFLRYHRTALTHQQAFNNEADLLEQFLQSPKFYQRAISTEQQLVDIGLLDEIEPRLLEAADSKASGLALLDQLQKNAQMWSRLVKGLRKRRQQSDTPLPLNQLKMLVDESMYTRNCIVEEILVYANSAEGPRRDGYIRHQHSYNTFGRHYMLVFYSQNEASPLSEASVRDRHHDLLFELNAQLQSPVMDDLFLIGVAFRPREGAGRAEVQIDVYHQAGAELSEGVRRLYDQVAQLKAQS